MLLCLLVLVTLRLVACIDLGSRVDLLVEEMFSKGFTSEEYKELPESGGCRQIYIPQGAYLIFGDPCTRVPPKAIPGANMLFIRNTRIKLIRAGDLDAWTSLEVLNLEMNEYLTAILPGSFKALTNLRNLSISNNDNLEVFEPGVFVGLNKLVELRLTKNQFSSIKNLTKALTPAILPSLLKLNLAENVLVNISSEDFEPMRGSGLTTLCLTMCGLVNIDSRSLAPLHHLTEVRLGRNVLDDSTLIALVLGLQQTAPHLRTLNIDANLLDKRPYKLLQTIAASTITRLEMRENHFDPLTSGFFPRMPNLESLDLTEILATYVENATIGGDIMPSLTRLVLAKNRLPGFTHSVTIPTLQEIDISQNSFDESSTLFNIGTYRFRQMKSLLILNLSKNNLFHLRPGSFVGLSSLRILLLQNCSIYLISDGIFEETPELVYLDLSYNTFGSLYPLTAKTFSGLSSLQFLNLGYCGISNFSKPSVFTSLINLKHLSLRGNSIIDLEPSLFYPMHHLYKLDLSYNDILHWNTTLFHNNNELKYLFIISNQISEFTRLMLEDFDHLTFLDLSDNPFVCDCELAAEVTDFLESTNNTLEGIHLDDTPNYCFSPRAWSTVKISWFIQEHRNCRKGGLLLGLLLGGAFIFFVTVAATWYWGRYHFAYWYFLIRTWAQGSRFPKRPATFRYDAFVSYSNEDRNFVVRMVSMLEKYPPYLSLCVFERDFDIGEVISERVVSSVEASRKTVLVLTDAFARSQWCLWEMHIAQHGRFFRRPDPLVIIKLGSIMESHMTPTLRYLMRTRIYLEWHQDPKKQRLFWQKLRQALAPDKTDHVPAQV